MRRSNRIKRIAILLFIVLSTFFTKKFLKRDVINLPESWIGLYRILGNDLPPRHSFNQTRTNLLFILQNEPSFINLTKIWILNRIVNSYVEQTLIDLINEYNHLYIRIPFKREEYRHIPYYFPSHYPSDEYFKSTNFRKLSSFDNLQLLDRLYHEKNLYVMNNNGARNFGLKHGKRETRSQWLIIFDGNCFLSQQGFDEIHQSLLINGSRIQYFVVPLDRLIQNNETFRLNRSKANEEPQLIFRRDSTVEFLETMRYGQRSKEELVTYLGVRKLIRISSAWDPEERKAISLFKMETNSLFQETSFIFRLYSGLNPKNERSSLARACSRFEGIIFFLESLDLKILNPKLLPKASTTKLHQCALWSDDELLDIVKTARQTMNITL